MNALGLEVPKHLETSTGEWWARVISECDIDEAEIRLLTLAAEAWDRCTEARKALEREGLVYLDRFGAPRSRPEIAIERDSRLAFARLIRQIDINYSEPDAAHRLVHQRADRVRKQTGD